MPKKLPSSSEAPWITLLAYHQRNLDLTTICWNYWGVTEALASMRQHSLHIWSFGQPAQILSAGYCPAGLSTGSSTSADRKLVHSLPQHTTDYSMRTEVFQLVHWMENLIPKKSSQGSTPPPTKFCFPNDSLGRALSILGYPSIRHALYSKECLEACERFGNIPEKL